ncbi:MAG: hypothetical protein QXT13_10295 [Pyrobaculum sp.]
MRKESKQETCPLCGKMGYRIVEKRGDRLYLYYKHFERVDDRKIQRNCYVGPLDGYKLKNPRALIQQLSAEELYSMLSDIQRQKLAELLSKPT